MGEAVEPSLVADVLCANMAVYDVRNRLAFRQDGKARFTVRVRNPGAELVIARAERLINDVERLVTHESMLVIPAWQGRRIGRNIVNNHITLYINRSYQRVHLVAAGEGGGYAWARAGFEADLEEWEELSTIIALRIDDLESNVDAQVLDGCREILSLGPRQGLWFLADLDQIYLGRPLGNILLRGTRWSGQFDLTDAEALARLDDWVNREDLK